MTTSDLFWGIVSVFWAFSGLMFWLFMIAIYSLELQCERKNNVYDCVRVQYWEPKTVEDE